MSAAPHLTDESVALALALHHASQSEPAHTATVDLVLPSTANLREHFAAKATRTKTHRSAGFLLARSFKHSGEKLLVVLTRHSQRSTDSDNRSALFKGVRDGVADALGVDDRSERVVWHCQQVKSKDTRVSLQVWRLS